MILQTFSGYKYSRAEIKSSFTLYYLLLSKGGSQRLTSGAKNLVGSGVAVPDAVAFVTEVLDPVSGQGQLGRVVAVTGVRVPAEVTERALQHAQEAVHIAHNKL